MQLYNVLLGDMSLVGPNQIFDETNLTQKKKNSKCKARNYDFASIYF